MSKYDLSLFIFRRDLRLHDNTALLHALKESKQVIPCFILDPRQLQNNPYRGEYIVQFMQECLEDLQEQLRNVAARFYIFQGKAEEVVAKLIPQLGIQALFVNSDYTPFSQYRDRQIESVCNKAHAKFHGYHDVLLQAPGKVLKEDNSPYVVYTPFFRKASEMKVAEPMNNSYRNYYIKNIAGSCELPDLTTVKNSNLYINGGRKIALAILESIKNFRDYKIERDYPAIKGTTGLSAHHKFGTVSIREVFYCVAKNLGRHHTLIKELYWRDFFTHIAYHFPHVFEGCFYRQYNRMSWNTDQDIFQKWCDGMTGYPIIDAGMRQLNETGYMHNRVRMIVASFLMKDLHISWRWGERYFAQKLIDYDPCVNNGNWQWAASTGCDAQPYFRIFNPSSQQKKFDKDCEYVKKWVPELRDVAVKDIHNLRISSDILYPRLIVDHSVARNQIIEKFKKVRDLSKI